MMEFAKILTIGMGESNLDGDYWKKLDALAKERKSLAIDSQEIKRQLHDTDCLLVVPFSFKLDKEIIDAAPNLKYIGVFSTGYGKVEIDYAKSRDIPVCNIPGYSTEAVSEFVFAALLEHIRNLEGGKIQARKGNHSEEGFSAIEIKDKVFGVIGLGRIGGRVAEIALGFGADVRYWSKNRKKEFEEKGIKYEDIDSLIPKCDFLSLNLALTKETVGFLTQERIKKIKKGGILINTVPMELVDIPQIERRLKDNEITFILDHSDEMVKEDLDKLSKHKNCVIYPPIAYVTKEARVLKQEIFIGNIESFLKGSPINRVN